LTISPEGLLVNTFLSSPITTNCHVQDHIELLIEWPLVFVSSRLLLEDLVHLIVAGKEYDIWPPFDSVCVPLLHIHTPGATNLCAD
jgi:hypothetical protein